MTTPTTLVETRPTGHGREGALLGKSRAKDVVDASVAALAIRRHADIVTDDAKDIVRLLASSRAKVAIVAV